MKILSSDLFLEIHLNSLIVKRITYWRKRHIISIFLFNFLFDIFNCFTEM